jgi:ABC-2 type transport system ATP-binding protein
VLDGFSLTISRGESFGLLGPNGAGKSTAVKLMLGLLRPDGGKALVLGLPPGSPTALAKIGFLPENPRFYNHLTGQEFLLLSGTLAGLSPKILNTTIAKLLARLSLEEMSREQIGNYSLGTQQRLGLAQALLAEPEVLFLDEPMNGLDPLGRMSVRQLLQELKSQGTTIFLNSHLLNDVEALCDRCGILCDGKLISQENIGDLINSGQYRDLDDYFLKTVEKAKSETAKTESVQPETAQSKTAPSETADCQQTKSDKAKTGKGGPE